MNAAGPGLGEYALARLLSRLERGDPGSDTGQSGLAQPDEPAMVVGVSGPPGVGKSVLLGRLLQHASTEGRRIAVLAVDPTSSLTGGAILGDRMRMQAIGVPAGVFIRSLASRGALGGLAGVVPAAVRVLEAARYDLILVETVGVGQNEADILGVADTVVIVQSPGAGDEVQALKSGLLEIGDVYVLNKRDLAGAAAARAALSDITSQPREDGWLRPLVETSAISGDGTGDLWQAIGAHRAWLIDQDRLARRRRTRREAALLLAARAELERRLKAMALLERFGAGEIGEQAALQALFGTPSQSLDGSTTQGGSSS